MLYFLVILNTNNSQIYVWFSSDDDEVPLYDQFIEEPTADEDRTSGVLMKFFTKVFKLLSYFIFFGLVFFGALISKVKYININFLYT